MLSTKHPKRARKFVRNLKKSQITREAVKLHGWLS